MPLSKVAEVNRLAVQTRVYPLCEVIDGKYIMGRKVSKTSPVEVYVKSQRRYKHMSVEQIQTMQSEAKHRYEWLVWRSEAGI